MTSIAVEAIRAKALALKPDGMEGVLNHLDPEISVLKNLGARLQRRSGYLNDLKKALATAPNTIDKEPLRVMVEPLSQTIEKIQAWLNHAYSSIIGINKEVKRQNEELEASIRDFSIKNQRLNLDSNEPRSVGTGLSRIEFARAA